MNTDAPWPTADVAAVRVLGIQAKLHRWATENPRRRFDDLDNLVAVPIPSWSWPGSGSRAIAVHAQQGWTGRPPDTSLRNAGRSNSSLTFVTSFVLVRSSHCLSVSGPSQSPVANAAGWGSPRCGTG